MVHAFNTGKDALNWLAVFVIKDATYFLRSLSISTKRCLVGVRSTPVSLPLRLKSSWSCLTGVASLETDCNFCLACSVAGPMWLKLTLPVGNILLSWFHTGSTCWKIYIQPVTAFGFCIWLAVHIPGYSPFQEPEGEPKFQSLKKSSSSSFFTSSGFVYSHWVAGCGMALRWFVSSSLTNSVKQVVVVLPDATAISGVSVVDVSPNHMN